LFSFSTPPYESFTSGFNNIITAGKGVHSYIQLWYEVLFAEILLQPHKTAIRQFPANKPGNHESGKIFRHVQ
jgi:hypothetical protein